MSTEGGYPVNHFGVSGIPFREKTIDPAYLRGLVAVFAGQPSVSRYVSVSLSDAARNVTLHPDDQVVLARHSDVQVRVALAANPRVTEAAIDILVADPSPRVLRKVYRRKNVTEQHRRHIIERLTATTQTDADPILAEFGRDLDYTMTCFGSTSSMARCAAARNSALTAHHVAVMFDTLVDLVDRERAALPAAPGMMHRDEATALLSHPQATGLVAAAATHRLAVLRVAAARSPHASLDVLAVSAVDGDARVRDAAREHPRYGDLPDEILVEAALLDQ